MLRQQSTATVGISVMQCLITLFNHAEISFIRSEDFVVSGECRVLLWFALGVLIAFMRERTPHCLVCVGQVSACLKSSFPFFYMVKAG